MAEATYSTEILPYSAENAAFFDRLPAGSLEGRLAAQYALMLAMRVELEQVRESSGVDDLTGLLRRQPFEDAFAMHLREQQRIDEAISSSPDQLRRGDVEARGLALLNIDLDDFDQVNNGEGLGHEAGDEALVKTAEVLKATVREQDLVCRWGGDEILVLLNQGVDYDAALAVSRRIREGLEEIVVFGREGLMGASIGLSMYEPGMSMEDMRREGYRDMYEDKQYKAARKAGRQCRRL